jgi:hypothetical protein
MNTETVRPDPVMEPAPSILEPINDGSAVDRERVPSALYNEAPAFDESALRARETEVARREAELDAITQRRREVTTVALTDKDVESQIVSEYAVCAYDAYGEHPNVTLDAERALRCITMVVLVLRNGFPIVGTSVCAAPENYDANEGRKLARADAIDKLWFAEQYAQRNKLMGLDVPLAVVSDGLSDSPVGEPLLPTTSNTPPYRQ